MVQYTLYTLPVNKIFYSGQLHYLQSMFPQQIVRLIRLTNSYQSLFGLFQSQMSKAIVSFFVVLQTLPTAYPQLFPLTNVWLNWWLYHILNFIQSKIEFYSIRDLILFNQRFNLIKLLSLIVDAIVSSEKD